MKRSVRILLVFLAVLLVGVILSVVLPSGKRAPLQEPGDVLATYAGFPVTRADVELARSMNEYRDEREQRKYSSDRAIVNELIKNYIVYQYAESQGLAATDEEIEQLLSATEDAYALPDGKEFLDQYCQQLGISYEQYLASLRELSPRTIARGKLYNQLLEHYAEARGIELGSGTIPEEILQDIDDFYDTLFARAASGITYYIS